MHFLKKNPAQAGFHVLLLAISLALAGAPAQAMDTDIFTVQNNAAAAPNVLIVLDNTSNWSRQNQHWPGGIVQGQAEVNAIKSVINNLPGNVNVGLLEFPAKGNANDNGGYVRFAVTPVGTAAAANTAVFSSTLDTIYGDINGTTEKQNSNEPYGNYLYDAYNYFAGSTPFAPSADVLSTGHADSRGYVSNYTQFKSPLSIDTNCANNYIIFIGNPNASGPASDDATNTAILNQLLGTTPLQELPLPQYTQTSQTQTDKLGYSACYSKQPNKVSEYSDLCSGSGALYSSCAYDSTDTSTLTCSSGQTRYQVLGTYTSQIDTPTNTFGTDTNQWNADEWAKLMHQKGVPVPAGQNQNFQTINTYTIDVYNAQPNPAQSSLLSSMARAGGGKYFTATNQSAIVDALTKIFAEIQAVNSVFASASLPISATNRSQNDNQVYIGMFRPDPTDHPRWFGNLKRYQVGVFNGTTDLADKNGLLAINSNTGFITPCATSWWTTDAGNYWYDTTNNKDRIFITDAVTAGLAWQPSGNDTDFAKGSNCSIGAIFSDLPDGATVEKGGAAQILRQQGSRNVKTLSGNSLVDFNTSSVASLSGNTTINTNIVNFIRGLDVTGEIGGVAPASPSATRPSIHGDVVHSRPLPVDYGNGTVMAYYGAGDGTYHAVNASTGAEAWSFVAPESFGTLQRLLDNSPLVQTPSPTPPGGTAIAGTTPKPFFFDGSTGLYQNADNSKIWIYPAMRRGGRMLYAFDASSPTSPSFKWKMGCPNQGNDTGCSSGMSGLGQTWSTPNVAFLTGYSSTTPVVIVGGGYDTCEDTDSATSTCVSPKGAHVYVLDADTGTVLKTLDTDRSIAGDVTLVDINQDGQVDAAYAADTGGSLYRIDFSDPTNNFAALGPASWTIHKVAYTTGHSRKFLFAPAVLTYKNKVYLAMGSGDREHPLAASYPYTSPVTNRFYVYLDDPLRNTATDLDGDRMLNKTDASLATCNSTSVLPGGTAYGWYMDLNANGTGEQTVTSSLIIGGMATFSTNRPVVSNNSCTTTLGEARGYWVNLINGSGAIGSSSICGGDRSAIFVGGGLPPSPVAGTIAIGGKPQVVVIGAIQRDKNGTSSPLSGQQVRPPITSKRTRTYWKTNADTH
ncbi:MAG: PilC/PilY family type IV pilus protein [Formivibrio sp.]|nr:PilC/PilY family type IV pilus protein [Formivibrio sp.]